MAPGGRRTHRALAAAVAVLAAAGMRAAPAPAGPAERPFPTLVALGWHQPLQTREGAATPVVYADHESGGHFAGGTLRLRWETAQGRAGMTHPLAGRWRGAYRARLRLTTEGDGRDLYHRGERLRRETFLGDSAALILALHREVPPAWRVSLAAERLWARFSSAGPTRPGYDLPPDFRQDEARLSLRRTGSLPGAEEGTLRLSWTVGRRQGWDGWALQPAAGSRDSYQKQALRWRQPVRWSPAHSGETRLDLLGGHDLDLFSGYAVGGLAGDEPVGGYYRNEFRARRLALAAYEHDWAPAADRVLSVSATAAWLEELPLALPGRDPGERTLAALVLGYRYGLRALGGLPVIVRYAEGLLIPAGSPEGHRREVLLLLAAGF